MKSNTPKTDICSHSPTLQIADDLQRAYDFFNAELFSGKLPKCSVTLRCNHPVPGYFACSALVDHEGNHFAHEIRLNPSFFMSRTLKETLSSLVHEMTHLWDAEFNGKTTRRQAAYHSRAWGIRMKSMGLHPSETGMEFMEDGKTRPKESGDKMSQYIVHGGPFDLAADRFTEDERFRLRWVDCYPASVPTELAKSLIDSASLYKPEILTLPLGSLPATKYWRLITSDEAQLLPERHLRAAATKVNWPMEPGGQQTRAKYECYGCHTLIWGKPGLAVRCVTCDMPFEITTRSRAYSTRGVRSSSSLAALRPIGDAHD